MPDQTTRYGISVQTDLSYDQAVEKTRAELAEEGFGILTEIDVAATLKKKLDVEFPPYIILGACNPPLAHRALQAEGDIGVLLPCNVVVASDQETGKTRVVAMDPEAALALTGNAQVGELAADVRARLERVLDRVAAG